MTQNLKQSINLLDNSSIAESSCSGIEDNNNNNNNNNYHPITILMVSTEYPPMYGGVGRYTYNLTDALRKLGHIVHIACNENGKDGNFFGLSPFNKNNSEVLLNIVNNIKPDIVHIQFEHGLYGIKLDPIEPRNTNTNIDSFYDICKVPIVTTFHSAYTFKQWMKIIPSIDLNNHHGGNSIYRIPLLIGYLYQNWKHFINFYSFHNLNNEKLLKSRRGIVLSNYLKNRIIEKIEDNKYNSASKSDVHDNYEDNNNYKNKNVVIYHGAEPAVAYFSNIKEEARKQFGIYFEDNKTKRRKNLALAIGFSTNTKGWDILSEIDLPENWFIVVNSSKNHFNTENYKPKYQSKNFKGIIDLHRDFLNDRELSLLFYACDVVLLPYKVSSGSGVMFDALAHGLPFIATDLGFFKEFAIKGLGITVRRHAKEFKKALEEMEVNYEYYSNAVKQFKSSLNWQTIANQHSKLYSAILAEIKHSNAITHITSSTTILPINKIKN